MRSGVSRGGPSLTPFPQPHLQVERPAATLTNCPRLSKAPENSQQQPLAYLLRIKTTKREGEAAGGGGCVRCCSPGAGSQVRGMGSKRGQPGGIVVPLTYAPPMSCLGRATLVLRKNLPERDLKCGSCSSGRGRRTHRTQRQCLGPTEHVPFHFLSNQKKKIQCNSKDYIITNPA